jgi:hypothetical protein
MRIPLCSCGSTLAFDDRTIWNCMLNIKFFYPCNSCHTVALCSEKYQKRGSTLDNKPGTSSKMTTQNGVANFLSVLPPYSRHGHTCEESLLKLRIASSCEVH